MTFAVNRGLKTSATISSKNPEDPTKLDYYIEFRGDPYVLWDAFDVGNKERKEIMDFKLLGVFPVSAAMYEPPEEL